MIRLTKLEILLLVLLIIGGLNWGLVGIAEFDLVAALFGQMSVLSRVVYCVVGLSAVLIAVFAFADSNKKQTG